MGLVDSGLGNRMPGFCLGLHLQQGSCAKLLCTHIHTDLYLCTHQTLNPKLNSELWLVGAGPVKGPLGGYKEGYIQGGVQSPFGWDAGSGFKGIRCGIEISCDPCSYGRLPGFASSPGSLGAAQSML